MESSSETEDTNYVENDSEKTFVCSYEGCSAKFSKNRKLITHTRHHTGQRPFTCNEPNCNKSYTNSSHLLRHKKIHQVSVVQKLKCQFDGCNLYFAHKYSLEKHCRRIHSELKDYRYNCESCTEGFPKKRQLQKHSFVHTGIRPFCCEICNSRFLTYNDCNRHKRTHTKYTCECSEEFERWSKLIKHKQTCETLKPKCSVCNKRFSNKTNLKLHARVHDDDRFIYWCTHDDCPRFYMYKKNLDHHVNAVHLKVPKKTHPCIHAGCDKSFIKKASLVKHAETHTQQYVKPKVARKTRKDKGRMQRSTALKLSGLKVPFDIEKAIVEGKRVEMIVDSDDDLEMQSPSPEKTSHVI